MSVPEIAVAELEKVLASGAPLVDVREPDEFGAARVPGARLVPLGSVPDRVAEIPTDQTVYVICRSGARSARAVEFLRAQGVDAINVAGGTNEWVESGRQYESGPAEFTP